MGTELLRRGADTGLPLWSARALAECPETVRAVHADYVQAGADIITTNTFRTTPRTFRKASLPDASARLTAEAVRLAREARAGRDILVAGSIAPLEDCYHPECVPPDADLEREHSLHAERLAAAGADFLLAETMTTLREARAVCRAACATGLETAISFVCRGDGRLYGGDPLEDAVQAVADEGAAAVSLNCMHPRLVDTLVVRLLKLTGLPVMAYGNVGRQGMERTGKELEREVGPEAYAAHALGWLRAGAAAAGGCCGTTPGHIRLLSRRLREEQGGSPAGAGSPHP